MHIDTNGILPLVVVAHVLILSRKEFSQKTQLFDKALDTVSNLE